MIYALISSIIIGSIFTFFVFIESILFMAMANDPSKYNIKWSKIPIYAVLFWIITFVSFYGVSFLTSLLETTL